MRCPPCLFAALVAFTALSMMFFGWYGLIIGGAASIAIYYVWRS